MSFISVKNNKAAIAISKRRWLRRLNIFSLPNYGSISWKTWKVFIYLKDWKGPSFHIINDGVESYENHNYEVLKKVCKTDSVFFDVGANVGIFSLRLAQERSDITIYAFEPEPNASHCLRQTIEANSITSISLFQTALSNKEGNATFYFDGENHGGHSLNSNSIIDSGSTILDKFSVSLTTLDQMVQQHSLSRLDVVKIDVQLHEESVLQGARQSIKNFRPIFLIECYLNELKKNPSPLIQPFIEAGGYSIFDPMTKRFYAIDTYSELLNGVHSHYQDLFFIPIENLDQFHKI